MNEFVDILGTYGITNSGDGSTPNVENPLTNLFGKLSINTGEGSQLELSYNYSDADLGAYIRNPTGVAITGRMRDGWQLSNSGYTQLGKVNALRARWIAEFGGGLSNEFLTGYQTVRDSRELPEQVPLILTAVGNIGAATSWLAAGAERFSQTNSLDQNIFSVADNLSFGTGHAPLHRRHAERVLQFRQRLLPGEHRCLVVQQPRQPRGRDALGLPAPHPDATAAEGADRADRCAAVRPLRPGPVVAVGAHLASRSASGPTFRSSTARAPTRRC